MFENLWQLVILFFVIFDPFVSMAVFFSATKGLRNMERHKTAIWAVLIAALISAIFLLFGQEVMSFLLISITDLQAAGGIILALLGIKMALGHSLGDTEKYNKTNAKAIAAIIGTPLLTGPAAITTIIISVAKYGIPTTSLAVGIVLAFTAILLYLSPWLSRVLGQNATQVISTLMGIVTIAWGIMFLKAGFGF